MASKKQENFIWDFGFYNALLFIQTAWKYSSNFEILLNETRFQHELNIHVSLDDCDEIFNIKLKKQNFQKLKLSTWPKRETVFSALVYVFERDSKNNKLSSTIRFYIRDQIPYICNNLYSNDIIELYKKFNFFKLYSEQCIVGCQDIFISENYSNKHSFYLNHIGLENYLIQLKIDIKTFSEIKILCNKNQNYTFFVLFLQKYKFNHYEIFFKQAKYDFLTTKTEFFTLKKKNVHNFIDCNSFDYDFFSLEFNKIEQQRVFTLVKIYLQKRNERITQKSKQILIYVCNSKPVKYTGAFIAITFIIGRYFAIAALATPINPNQASESVGVAATYAESPARRGRPLGLNAPYFKKGNLENLGVQAANGKTEIINEGVLYFEQVPRPKKKTSVLTGIKEKTKSAVKSAADCLIKPRPSNASSDIISSVPVIKGNLHFYTTKCKIANGRLYNETSKNYVVKSEFDNMIKPDSFVAFGEKTYYTEKTIYRAEIKPETLGNLKNQKYFVIFYPRGEKGYIVTVCGNTGQSKELKSVAAKVQMALETDVKAFSDAKNEKAKQAYYVYGGMTFEHGVPDLYSEVLGIGRTDRSNTNDSSYGLSIGDSLNKRMGKNQPSWADIYDLNVSTIFNESEAKNFCNFFLDTFLQESVNLGNKSIQRRCNEQITEKLNEISKVVETKMQEETYAALSPKQQVKVVHEACHEAVLKMLLSENVKNSKEFQKNAFFDRDIFLLYAENYRIVHEFYCKKARRYGSELGVKPTQVSVCFFLDVCLLESQNNLTTEFKSLEYEQPVGSTTKLVCPIENSVQNLQRAMDISEAAELICKHAELTWPNDPALQKALKKRKQKLSFINADFSSRAKTNLDMVKNLNSDFLRVYTKQKGPVSVSTKVDEKVSVSLKVDENDKVSVSLKVDETLSMKMNVNENKEVPVELAENNLQQKSIDNRDEYICPLKKKLNLFNNKRDQSENHLNSFSEANEKETDFGFITPENKTLNSDQTHNFLFRTGKISLNNSLQISRSCKATQFVDPFWSENQNNNSYNYSQANETLTPTAVRVGTRTYTRSGSGESTLASSATTDMS